MRARVIGTILVTVIEVPAVFLWLYWYDLGYTEWAIVVLVLGELVETGLLVADVSQRPKITYARCGLEAARRHFHKMRAMLAASIVAEIAIWLVWLAVALEIGQLAGAVVLIVLMHLKHQLETVAVRDVPYRDGFLSLRSTAASLFESLGAVGALYLILEGEPLLGALALLAGIGIEHWILIKELLDERDRGDIRLPRDCREPPEPDWMARWFWTNDGLNNSLLLHFGTHYPWLWRFLSHHRRSPKVNRTIINLTVQKVPYRPNPLSTMSDYTSWTSLTDRRFSGRHLPPAGLYRPGLDDTMELFKRDGAQKLSKKSTLLFPHFAQWFTDGFIRTDPVDPRKNRSTHDIDLCQLYGQTTEVTEMLRLGKGGKLKYQRIGDECFPPFYFEKNGAVKKEFAKLETRYPGHQVPGGPLDPELRSRLFALALARGNVHYGIVMMSTLFLREHNRLCDILAAQPVHWAKNDDRLFETARNIAIAMLLKIVIEDYINHITPFRFRLIADPELAERERWYRQNWMAAEFDLLYRWHSLVPDTVEVGGERRPMEGVQWDNRIVLDNRLGALFEEASGQPSTEMGLRNTPDFLLPVERKTVKNGRDNRLASYNDYREACTYGRLSSFADVSSDPDIRRRLKDVYRRVDNIELYVGLLAEDVRERSALPLLMGTMVGADAFSQALTNPLLSSRIYNADTFTEVGLREIRATGTLADIVDRNVAGGATGVTLTQAGWDG
jgi:prostaglandin-endoperoxide synthase 2